MVNDAYYSIDKKKYTWNDGIGLYAVTLQLLRLVCEETDPRFLPEIKSLFCHRIENLVLPHCHMVPEK